MYILSYIGNFGKKCGKKKTSHLVVQKDTVMRDRTNQINLRASTSKSKKDHNKLFGVNSLCRQLLDDFNETCSSTNALPSLYDDAESIGKKSLFL